MLSYASTCVIWNFWPNVLVTVSVEDAFVTLTVSLTMPILSMSISCSVCLKMKKNLKAGQSKLQIKALKPADSQHVLTLSCMGNTS